MSQGLEHGMFQLQNMPKGFHKYGFKKDMNDILVGHKPIERHDSKISRGNGCKAYCSN